MADYGEQIMNMLPRSPMPSAPLAKFPGMKKSGNINTSARPKVSNNGQTSTVLSASFGMPDGEVLLPLVSDDGRILSPQEAVQNYRQTGKHLGVFDTPQNADAYAQALHQQQSQFYGVR